ncbi:NAD(+)/NADH kinase [Nitrospinae bacterium]|nr:NAD(+)/NADH kinase [Nitrospinota bacterium]
MKKVGIFCKQKPNVDAKIVSKLTFWLESKSCAVYLEPNTADLIGKTSHLSKEEVAAQTDLLIVLGGDGTLLNVAGFAHPHEVPILGVNLGSLGFLTETTMENLYPTLEKVLDRKCEIENRMLLNASVLRNGKNIEDFNVLNDIVINKGALARILNLKVFVDDQYMTSYRADGLIIASPTGSTAYSLSAGGPIIHPSMHALVLSPICPFALTNRPIVVPDSSVIRVQLTTRNADEDVRITLDGQTGYSIKSGDILEAKKADIPVKLIQAPGKNYYQLLRKKLHWGGTAENNL